MPKKLVEHLEGWEEVLIDGDSYQLSKILEADVKLVVKGSLNLHPVFLPFGTKVKYLKPKVVLSTLEIGERFKFEKSLFEIIDKTPNTIVTVNAKIPILGMLDFYPATLVTPVEQPITLH